MRMSFRWLYGKETRGRAEALKARSDIGAPKPIRALVSFWQHHIHQRGWKSRFKKK
jgi:hypothetical protein